MIDDQFCTACETEPQYIEYPPQVTLNKETNDKGDIHYYISCKVCGKEHEEITKLTYEDMGGIE